MEHTPDSQWKAGLTTLLDEAVEPILLHSAEGSLKAGISALNSLRRTKSGARIRTAKHSPAGKRKVNGLSSRIRLRTHIQPKRKSISSPPSRLNRRTRTGANAKRPAGTRGGIRGLRKYRYFPVRTASAVYKAGFRAGQEDGRHISLEGEPYQKKALNRNWLLRANAMKWLGTPWSRFTEAAKGYINGFFKVQGHSPQDWVLLPTNRSVAAIISVMNEEKTIGAVIDQLNRLPLDEIIVIVNGSSDRSFQQAKQRSHAVVLYIPEQLGHDVGRTIGAKLAQSDILLFLDGDIIVSAERLIPFVGGVESGLDVSLNDISPYLRVFSRRDDVTYMKQFLNTALGRTDLVANSMTAIPHALSRKAVDTIGLNALMVPPKAQVLAVFRGLRIGVSGSVDVIRGNKQRENNSGIDNRVGDMIIGDHLEALKLAGDLAGERFAFIDTMRNRSLAGGDS